MARDLEAVKIDYVMENRLNDIIEAARWAEKRAQEILDSGVVEYRDVAIICDRLHNTAALSRP